MAASSSGHSPTSGERSTAIRGTSCRGLSTISSSDTVTAISIAPKKSSLSPPPQGMPSRASAAVKARIRDRGERMRITMSSGRTGRMTPPSPCTGKPSSSSCRMRRAAKRASVSVRSNRCSGVSSTLMTCISVSRPAASA